MFINAPDNTRIQLWFWTEYWHKHDLPIAYELNEYLFGAADIINKFYNKHII